MPDKLTDADLKLYRDSQRRIREIRQEATAQVRGIASFVSTHLAREYGPFVDVEDDGTLVRPENQPTPKDRD